MSIAQPPLSSRNVLMIIADDWSPLAGCYGTPGFRTPHIDAFASAAMRFNRAYCTAPTCAASRACILTGLHSHTHGLYGLCHGIHGFRGHEHIVSLPRMMANSTDFFCGIIGKNHVAPDSAYPWDFNASRAFKHTMQNANEMVNALHAFYREAGARSTFLMVAPSYPHRAGSTFGNHLVFPGLERTTYDPETVYVPPFLPDLPEVRADLADYYEAIDRFDQCVGAVLRALEQTDRAANTMVIVLSDHGMPFPGAKASSFEAGHLCPLLMRVPGITQTAQSTDVPVTWLDLFPTIREYLGLPEPSDGVEREGASLLHLPTDRERCFASHCFHEITQYYPYRIIWEGRYKFVRHYAAPLPYPMPSDIAVSKTWHAIAQAGDALDHPRNAARILRHDPEALFDLEADPLESNNLIKDPAFDSLVSRMRREMDEFQRRTRDPWAAVTLPL